MLTICLSLAAVLLGGTESQTAALPPPELPPGTTKVLNFDRRGNQEAVCAEKAGDPIVKGGRRIPQTEVWYRNPQVIRKTALGPAVCDPAWSPDGRRLAVVTPEGLWVLSDVFRDKQDSGERLVDSQPQAALTGKGEVAFSKPAWSPDGSRIAYVASSGHSTWVEVVDVATGQQLAKSEPGSSTFSWGADSRSLQVGGKTVRVP